ncbi:MAG: HNH endonuclease [Prevotella sp.]|nr:HNH endonuclease [Prevotella sp.]
MKKKAIESNSNHVSHVSHQTQHEEGEQYLKNDGEVYTTIYDTECRVCDLVWEAFKGVIPEGYMVVHIDGNKTNNRLDNLKLKRL